MNAPLRDLRAKICSLKVNKDGDAGKLKPTFNATYAIRSVDDYGLWHNRLGPTPLNKLKLIGCVRMILVYLM